MYKAFFGMEFNPFSKGIDTKHYFESDDFKQASARLDHLKNIKGIGVFTGCPGMGKTFAIRSFVNSLNPNLYKVVYIPLSTVTVIEFYKALAYDLDIEVSPRKIDLFRDIQARLRSLVTDKKLTPVIIIDEAQYLKTAVLDDLKVLLNFEMDSKNYASLILTGQSVLNHTLSKQVHEALKQRVVINYNFNGISKDEVEKYISSRFALCGVHNKVFDDNAISSLHACSGGSVRKLNSVIERCLIIAYSQNKNTIDTDIVMAAQNETELM
ncbi:MAG: hypothetical protein A2Y22_08795 [Clostridiales bacterium GWD2_32_59]|nr:MAG: hypothetical protein A2Y22_08795 [Clostridiales bacterium GWD2_32_59]